MRRWTYVTIAIAALQGGAGVVLAAVSAHVESSAHLSTASQYLVAHAGAALALSAIAASSGFGSRWIAAATLAMEAGVFLFSGDLSARALLGHKLFPYAAPIGGSLIILSWLLAAAWATAAARSRRAEEAPPPREP